MHSTIALIGLASLMPSALAQKGMKAPGGAAAGAAGGCSPLQLVYARATGEPAETARGWSQGYGAAGMSLKTNITELVPGADGYPVHYPASMNTQCQGAADLMKHLRTKSKECPEQKYALGGHSQGGFVVTISLKALELEILDKIVAVTMFGSPPCPPNVRGKCISYCNSGDPVCSGSSSPGSMEKCNPGQLPTKGGFIIEERSVPQQSNAPSSALLASVVERNIAASADCQKFASMNTKGGGKGGHMGYNADGTYVRAAACYVASKFKGGA